MDNSEKYLKLNALYKRELFALWKMEREGMEKGDKYYSAFSSFAQPMP